MNHAPRNKHAADKKLIDMKLKLKNLLDRQAMKQLGSYSRSATASIGQLRRRIKEHIDLWGDENAKPITESITKETRYAICPHCSGHIIWPEPAPAAGPSKEQGRDAG